MLLLGELDYIMTGLKLLDVFCLIDLSKYRNLLMYFGTNLSKDNRNLCVIIEPACIELTGSLHYYYRNYEEQWIR